jgi:AcrR family transcriptional regulator
MAVERVLPTDRAGREGGHVLEMQRRRLLSATSEIAYEHGVQGLSVATVCERSGLSRKTFYDLFQGREDCLYATFQDGVQQAARIIEQALAGERSWREQVRSSLAALLSFFDREPAVARLLIVEALSSGPRTLRARRRVLDRAIAFIDQGRSEIKAGHEPPPLTAEGTVGAVFSVIHARMLTDAESGERDRASLMELTGPLMAMIVQPYLGAAVARRELARPPARPDQTAPNLPSDPFKDLPIRFTYRTSRVLSTIAETPGASSKQVAQASGITDDGQASRLLSRLQQHHLIQDTGIGPTKGMPRAWTLTPRGEQILQAVGYDGGACVERALAD